MSYLLIVPICGNSAMYLWHYQIDYSIEKALLSRNKSRIIIHDKEEGKQCCIR